MAAGAGCGERERAAVRCGGERSEQGGGAAERLRVAHVDAESGFSGGEVQVLLLMRGLHARGHDNLLLSPPGSGLAAAASPAGLACEPVAMRNDLDLPAVLRLADALRRFAPDVVHLHTARATWLGGLAAWAAGVPAVTTRRMDRPVRRNLRTRLVYEHLVRAAVAISPGVAECLRQGGVAERRLRLIPSSVDPERLVARSDRAQVRAQLGAGPDDTVLLALCGLVRRKGVDVLLDALARLASGGLRPALWVAGDGPETAALTKQARDLGLQECVRFLGRRDDVGDLLAACDVFVLPSRREGLGVAALEAMAAGRAVVASRVGGLQDAVVDERTGLLVPPEDATALAAALARLLRDRSLRDRLGAAGPGRVAQGFLPDQMVAAYEKLYRSVLAGSEL